MAIMNIKKQKSVNKNVVATIIHNEYKDVLLNNKQILLKAMEVLIMLNFKIFLTLNYNLMILNLLLKIN